MNELVSKADEERTLLLDDALPICSRRQDLGRVRAEVEGDRRTAAGTAKTRSSAQGLRLVPFAWRAFGERERVARVDEPAHELSPVRVCELAVVDLVDLQCA